MSLQTTHPITSKFVYLTPKRLEGSGWKVALASISLPDPKNVLPSWLSGTQPFLYNQWYHARKANMNSKKFLGATFKVSDMSDVDLNSMSGVDFMKTAIEWLYKQRVENNMIPGFITRYTTVDGQTNEIIQRFLRNCPL